MPIPWAAQQQDAELIRELADYSIPMAAVFMAQSLLHLQRQLVLHSLDAEQNCAKSCANSGRAAGARLTPQLAERSP